MSHINFHNLSKTKSDNYETPKYVWEDIAPYVNKELVIYEPFYCSGESGKFLNEIGFKNVIHEDVDFFTNSFKFDMIISNPPYSNLKKILMRVVTIDKPFMLLMPITLLSKQYFKKVFAGKKVQLLIPKKRIHFSNIECKSTGTSKSYFDTCFFCYGIDLPNDITFL